MQQKSYRKYSVDMSMKYFYLPEIKGGPWVIGVFVGRIRIVFILKSSRIIFGV